MAEFDLKVHSRNAKGKIVAENYYILHVINGEERFERPPKSGIFYGRNGELLKGSVVPEDAQDEPVADADAKIAALEAQIAALQAKADVEEAPDMQGQADSDIGAGVDDVVIEVKEKKSLFSRPNFISGDKS